MLISLDYDNCYDLDSNFWSLFMRIAKEAGHQVIIVTMRGIPQTIKDNSLKGATIIYTCGEAKKAHLEAVGIHPQIWIDDDVSKILFNYDEVVEQRKPKKKNK